ncbi:MAG TPA: methyltransferase domain-containing protein, partial [Nocardioidaceae bacterium]|nr:methyltransferase domain-containing protein [Nocardioidaceae bacterium]
MTARFEGERAHRFARAMARTPGVRALEILSVLPLVWPAGPSSTTAVDLGCGPGYLSEVLEQLYPHVVRVDESGDMMQCKADPDHIISDLLTAARDLPPDTAPDLIASLATFHHVCKANDTATDRSAGPSAGSDRVVDTVASQRLQDAVIRAWAGRLRPGGRFVIVDVGWPRDPVSDRYAESVVARFGGTGTVPWAELEALDAKLPRYGLMSAVERFGLRSSAPGMSVSGLVDVLRKGLDVHRIGPIAFFDKVVAQYSLTGHDAHFFTEERLAASLAAAGLAEVTVGVVPTPWT